jgi:hypothetical protein
MPMEVLFMSRIIGILASVVQVLNLAAVLVGGFKPQYAIWIAAAAGAVSAFSERLQGGLSKTEPQ